MTRQHDSLQMPLFKSGTGQGLYPSYTNSFLKSTVKMAEEAFRFGGASVLNGMGDLYRIKDILTKYKYHSILQRYHAMWHEAMWTWFCPKHTSKPCQVLFKKRGTERWYIALMDFPPQSPGLSPIEHFNSIEHLWERLKREKLRPNPTSLNNLLDVPNDCWKNIKHK